MNEDQAGFFSQVQQMAEHLKNTTPMDDLSSDLRVATAQGDPIKVAAYAFLIWWHGAQITQRDVHYSSHLKYDDLMKEIDLNRAKLAEREAVEARQTNPHRRTEDASK